MRSVSGVWPLVILGAFGCGRAIVQPLGPTGGNADAGRMTGQPDAGRSDLGTGDLGAPDLGSVPCDRLEEAQCGQATECQPLYCPTCDVQNEFFGCHDSQEVLSCPDLICPGGACEDIGSQASCDAEPGCGWSGCYDCDGNPIVESCSDESSPLACPPIDCPAECETLGENECVANPECHAVFNGDQAELCDCDAPGCCVVFERCAEGAYADCSFREVVCNRLPPTCDGPYVTSYTENCYEGCALIKECVF